LIEADWLAEVETARSGAFSIGITRIWPDETLEQLACWAT